MKFLPLILFCFLTNLVFANPKTVDPKLKEKANTILKQQKVKFTENKGQMTDMAGKPVPFVLFKAQAPGVDLYLTEKGLTYVLLKMEEGEEKKEHEKNDPFDKKEEENIKVEWERIEMMLKGATIKKENISVEGKSSDFKQYYLTHCPKGIFDVHDYEKLTIKNIYPHIDWVLYNSSEKGFKYDFIVHPGANANDIEMVYTSQKPLKLNNEGELIINSKLGTLTENKPISFLSGQNITTEFVVKEQKAVTVNKQKGYETSIAFNFPNTNTLQLTSDLIIDPQLVWGTFFGGDGMCGPMDITTDNLGNLYITGYTAGASYPFFNLSGAYFNTSGGTFLIKFNNTNTIIWSTYLEFFTALNKVKVDEAGNIYMIGGNAFAISPIFLAGAYNQSTSASSQDLILVKFNPAGSATWATYFGGNNLDIPEDIYTDNLNNVYITGLTASTDFPIQNLPGAYNQSFKAGGLYDAFLIEFNSSGALIWSTYIGGIATDIAKEIKIDNLGNLYCLAETNSSDFPIQNFPGAYNQPIIKGDFDFVLLKFNSVKNLVWSTFFGGTTDDSPRSLAIDGANNVYISGHVYSIDFPIQNLPGAFNKSSMGGSISDFSLSKFNTTGVLIWSTYIGGSAYEYETNSNGSNIVCDKCDNIYMFFQTQSSDVYTTINTCSYDKNFLSGLLDQFIYEFDNTGKIIWDSYIGGNGNEFRESIAVDINNNLYLTGEWAGWVGGTIPLDLSTYPFLNSGGTSYFDSVQNMSDNGYILKFASTTASINSNQINPETCQCNGIATVSVSVSSVCSEALNYYWSNGTSVLNSTLTTVSASSLCAGVHEVTITAECGFSKVVSFTLTGSSPPIISASNNTIACATNTVSLNGTGGGTYAWSGPSILSGSNTATPIVNAAGIYSLTVTDSNGCVATTTCLVSQIYATPGVTITPGITIILGSQTTLSLTTTASSYTWGPNYALSCLNCPNPIVSPSVTTEYCAIVTVGTCTNASCLTVFVNDFCLASQALNLPNTFTPNNDGLNDVFNVKEIGLCVQSFNISIYDRWGIKQFESNDYLQSWNGKVNNKGNDCPDGTYFYIINSIDKNNKKTDYKGFLTLFR